MLRRRGIFGKCVPGLLLIGCMFYTSAPLLSVRTGENRKIPEKGSHKFALCHPQIMWRKTFGTLCLCRTFSRKTPFFQIPFTN